MQKFLLSSLLATALLLPCIAKADSDDPNDYTVPVINTSHSSIIKLEVRHVAIPNLGIPVGEWTANLVHDPIEPGETAKLWMDSGQKWCIHDVRVKFNDGKRTYLQNVNTCAPTVVITYSVHVVRAADDF
jgi:hypothetical protein